MNKSNNAKYSNKPSGCTLMATFTGGRTLVEMKKKITIQPQLALSPRLSISSFRTTSFFLFIFHFSFISHFLSWLQEYSSALRGMCDLVQCKHTYVGVSHKGKWTHENRDKPAFFFSETWKIRQLENVKKSRVTRTWGSPSKICLPSFSISLFPCHCISPTRTSSSPSLFAHRQFSLLQR